MPGVPPARGGSFLQAQAWTESSGRPARAGRIRLPGLVVLAVALGGVTGAPAQVGGEAAGTEAAAPPGDLASHFVALRFFEAGAQAPPVDSREHATEFEAARSRYVWTEIEFRHPSAGRPVEFTVSCEYRGPDGSFLTRMEIPLRARAEWTGMVNANYYGYRYPGFWPLGSYTVSCSRDGEPVAEESFTMVAATPDLPSLGATLGPLQFFESGSRRPAREERLYRREFAADETRFVNTEVQFTMPAPGREVKVPVACLYIRPDGRILRSSEFALPIQPDWTRPYTAKGVGWEEPGHWEPGTYRVACVARGRLLDEASFTIR